VGGGLGKPQGEGGKLVKRSFNHFWKLQGPTNYLKTGQRRFITWAWEGQCLEISSEAKTTSPVRILHYRGRKERSLAGVRNQGREERLQEPVMNQLWRGHVLWRVSRGEKERRKEGPGGKVVRASMAKPLLTYLWQMFPLAVRQF